MTKIEIKIIINSCLAFDYFSVTTNQEEWHF